METQERNLYFSRVLSNFQLVKVSIDLLKSKGSLKKEDLDFIVEKYSSLSGTTIGRRASSLYAWLKWIATNTGAYDLGEGGIIKLK